MVKVQPNIFRRYDVEGAALPKNNLPKRVWDAVVIFFKHLIHDIKEISSRLWLQLKQFCCCISPKKPVGIASEDWFLHFNNMPAIDGAFLQKVVDIHRNFLQKKDQQLRASLKELGIDFDQAKDLDIPEERKPTQLASFNDDLESVSNTVLLLKLAIRAYIFSKTDFCPTFLEGHAEKIKDEPLPIAMGGGSPHVSIWIDLQPELEQMRSAFCDLSREEQVTLFQEYDPADIEKVPVSLDGKKILRDISGLADRLVQNNDRYCKALQKVH